MPLRHLLAPTKKNLSKHLCTFLVFNIQEKVAAVFNNSKKINKMLSLWLEPLRTYKKWPYMPLRHLLAPTEKKSEQAPLYPFSLKHPRKGFSSL